MTKVTLQACLNAADKTYVNGVEVEDYNEEGFFELANDTFCHANLEDEGVLKNGTMRLIDPKHKTPLLFFFPSHPTPHFEGPGMNVTFYPILQTTTAHILIWFRSADNRNCYKDMTLHLQPTEKAQDVLDYIFKYTTDLVRNNWFLIEVTTPLVLNYGKMEGGLHIMRATK